MLLNRSCPAVSHMSASEVRRGNNLQKYNTRGQELGKEEVHGVIIVQNKSIEVYR